MDHTADIYVFKELTHDLKTGIDFDKDGVLFNICFWCLKDNLKLINSYNMRQSDIAIIRDILEIVVTTFIIHNICVSLNLKRQLYAAVYFTTKHHCSLAYYIFGIKF